MATRRERRKVFWAVLASIVLHLLVAFSLAAFSGVSSPLPEPEDKPVELTFVDLPAKPTAPVNPPFMETDESKKSAEPPKEKTFESNANAVAASTLPATGDDALPSQEGKERPVVNLETHAASLDLEGQKPQPPPAPKAQPSQAPTPQPSATPQPTPETTPSPEPTATPPPVATPEPEEFAMLTATPPPAIQPPDQEVPSPTPEFQTSTQAPAPRPNPERPGSTYQPLREKTRISGRITKRGASSVDAVETPLGRYQKKVLDAIGSRWYYYIEQRTDLVNIGTAHVEAEIDERGQVRNLKLISNDANEAFANVCLQSFQAAQIPPIPPELVPILPEGRLPVDISFTTYSNR